MGEKNKKDTRREMRVMLANLDKRWEMVAHAKVCEHVESLVAACSTEAVRDIFAWVPCFPGEVDLAGFIAAMLRDGRRVYLPRIDGGGGMSFVRICNEWSTGLERIPSGVIQPRQTYGELLDPAALGRSLVVSPGLAFDSRGRRLGRGGGYYDRFLAKAYMQGAVKVGVCWSMQVIGEVPVDGHDIVMDWICHERGIVQVAR